MSSLSRAAGCWVVLALLAGGCNCSPEKAGNDGGRGDGGRGDGGADAGEWADFPSAPVFDDAGTSAVPANAPALFAGPGDGGAGPCLVEPQVGTLFPQNWLRPRFAWVPVGAENLFELRLHADHELNDLVVYTTARQWTLPASWWVPLASHVVDQPITVTIRGAVVSGSTLTAGPSLGSSGPITVAPVAATGTIVYWTPSGGSAFEGFAVGEEVVHPVLTPTQAGTACVGCHASSPDGLLVGFSASANINDGTQASVDLRGLDGGAARPAFLSASALALMARTQQQLPKFSLAHSVPGDRVAISMFPVAGREEIIWTDLEATSQAQGTGWGVLARTGDPGQADYASFDHTGQRVLYVSATTPAAGCIANDGLIRIVPYNARAGGASTAVPGASDPAFNQFYPVFSPDDALIAFNRVDAGQPSYNDAAAEVFVLPAAGGTPTRLAANDPPACSGFASPGITNSWPRWAPAVQTVKGRTYYWLAFSSKRTPMGNPQLYVTGVVVDATGVTSYPALYLWNQPATQNNHTPAWDLFQISAQ